MTRTFVAGVPIEPVLTAFRLFPVNGGNRFWCMFHPDERPGGKPSAEIDRNDPSFFHCWRCDEDWSAAQIIAELTGCAVLEGLQRSYEIAGDTRIVARPERPRLSPRQLEVELRAEIKRARSLTVDPVAAFMEARGWLVELADYAKTPWGWTGGKHGRVVIPSRDRDGSLRGLKWRIAPTWVKGSL